MTFFFDNNLSPRIAAGLREFGEDVTHLIEEFAPEAADEVWLSVVGKREWFVVTRDERIRQRYLELELVRAYSVGMFMLGGKNRTAWQLIQQVVRHWPRIKELAAKKRRPFIFRVPPSGTKIERVM